MVVVTVNNSLSKVEGLSDRYFKELRDILSYTAEGYYGGGRPPTRRYLIDKKGCFPTGLLPRVEAYLDEFLTYRMDDLRKQPSGNPGMFKLRLE